MVKPERSSGASQPMVIWPSWIMKPKMPAKVPRSFLLNQAVLILIMPGAPNDCIQPSAIRMSTNM